MCLRNAFFLIWYTILNLTIIYCKSCSVKVCNATDLNFWSRQNSFTQTIFYLLFGSTSIFNSWDELCVCHYIWLRFQWKLLELWPPDAIYCGNIYSLTEKQMRTKGQLCCGAGTKSAYLNETRSSHYIRMFPTMSFVWQIDKCVRVSKSFRTGHLEREMQMVQLSATRCSCIAILRVSLASFAVITVCVASQRVFIVVYFVIDSVRKLLDTPS
jgi:hypothetical protein